ncbi:MAG: hypothetical protein LBB63_03565 [Holosporaceae bacterium]|jgi:hypothetical protein|nr:hypothetical protein [Holosporaceae bacterium]
MHQKPIEKACTLRINEKLLEAIDFYRRRSFDTRKSWIVKAICEKLQSLEYDLEKIFEDNSKPAPSVSAQNGMSHRVWVLQQDLEKKELEEQQRKKLDERGKSR